MNEEIITAVDIGSSKIFGISGILRETGLEVIATDVIPSGDEMVRKGRVIDMEKMTNCLFDLFEHLKSQVGARIENWVVLGIGGYHVRGRLFQKEIAIEPPGREIEEADIQKLEVEIRNAAIAETESDRRILYKLIQEYFVDSSPTKKKPIGMHGNSFQAVTHVLTYARNPLQNIMDCVNNAGAQQVTIGGYYPHSWAVAESTLTEEERNLGALVIDFGRGTTDVCFYLDQTLVFTESFAVSGGNIDLDLSLVLQTPPSSAEELKKNHGWCNYEALVREKNPLLLEQVDIFNPAGKLAQQVTTEEISRIVYERVREILESFVRQGLIRNSLKDKASHFNSSSWGVVLSGGSSRLKQLPALAQEVFERPVRIGQPKKLPGIDQSYLRPEYASGIGLLLLGVKGTRRKPQRNLFKRVRERIRTTFF